MKIALVVQNYHPSVGGTQTLFQNIAEKLVNKYGDEVKVYTTNSRYNPHHKRFEKISPKIEMINGVTVVRSRFLRYHLPFFRLLAKIVAKTTRLVPPFFVRYIKGPISPELRRIINSTDADVILASSSAYRYMLYPLYRHKLKQPKPFVFMGAIHFYNDVDNPLFPSTLKAIKLSEVYVANTTYEKKRLIDLGVEESKIEVIGVGVDIEKYKDGDRNFYRKKLDIAEEDVLVGYVGRIEKVKGVEFLLQGFVEAARQKKNLRLVIAGFKSRYCDELMSIAKSIDKNISDRIHFVNDLSSTEKINLFNALDIFVLPSYNESFGIVFLEAWACKKPVIGMSIGAVASVIEDGEDGMLVNPGNTFHLAEKILQLSNDTSLRNKLGEAGYNKTAKRYTWDVIVEKYRNILLKAKQNFNV